MKVRIRLNDGKWTTSHTGKGYFMRTLTPELNKLGVNVTDSLDEHVDIDLQIGRWHYKPVNCKKTILRIGPVHVDTRKNHKWLNDRKKIPYQKADGVIFQSKFGKKMVNAFIGQPGGMSTIINNGAAVKDYAVDRSEDYYKYNFVCSAYDWMKQKRLSAIVRAYWKAGIKNSALWVAGNTGKMCAGTRDIENRMEVRKVGLLNRKELHQLYRKCDAMIHMVWLDCMPNAVCEAIANGCQVICNNSCGTKEVVKAAGGIVLKTDPKWKRNPVNTEKPPAIDDILLLNGMKDVLRLPKPNTNMVDIRNVAKRYVSFFESVLGGRMKIYIVVDVHYDYFRFQENLYASTSKDECLDFIALRNNKFKARNQEQNLPNNYEVLPIYEYKYSDKKTMRMLEQKSLPHYWIQEF